MSSVEKSKIVIPNPEVIPFLEHCMHNPQLENSKGIMQNMHEGVVGLTNFLLSMDLSLVESTETAAKNYAYKGYLGNYSLWSRAYVASTPYQWPIDLVIGRTANGISADRSLPPISRLLSGEFSITPTSTYPSYSYDKRFLKKEGIDSTFLDEMNAASDSFTVTIPDQLKLYMLNHKDTRINTADSLVRFSRALLGIVGYEPRY